MFLAPFSLLQQKLGTTLNLKFSCNWLAKEESEHTRFLGKAPSSRWILMDLYLF